MTVHSNTACWSTLARHVCAWGSCESVGRAQLVSREHGQRYKSSSSAGGGGGGAALLRFSTSDDAGRGSLGAGPAASGFTFTGPSSLPVLRERDRRRSERSSRSPLLARSPLLRLRRSMRRSGDAPSLSAAGRSAAEAPAIASRLSRDASFFPDLRRCQALYPSMTRSATAFAVAI